MPRMIMYTSIALMVSGLAHSQHPWQKKPERDPAEIKRIVGPTGEKNPSRDLHIVWVWGVDKNHDRGGHEVLDRSLIALDCLTHALSEGNDALQRKELTQDSYIKLISMVDETIHHLTASKNMLKKYAPSPESG